MTGYIDTPAQGSSVAATGTPAAEAGPVFSIQRCGVDSVDGDVHRAGALAGLYLVHHRQQRTEHQSGQLDCR